MLQCVAICCNVLQCFAVRHRYEAQVCCNALQCNAVCCSLLQCVAMCCSDLQDVYGFIRRTCVLTADTLQRTATHSNPLHHTAAHCHTRQQCNTLQRTATYYGLTPLDDRTLGRERESEGERARERETERESQRERARRGGGERVWERERERFHSRKCTHALAHKSSHTRTQTDKQIDPISFTQQYAQTPHFHPHTLSQINIPGLKTWPLEDVAENTAAITCYMHP